MSVKKHEWRKAEKRLYLPKNKPEILEVPSLNFFTIKGAGNPNAPEFAPNIQVLYALSYAIRMSPKKGTEPPGYFEYTVYPLEGVWDVSGDVKANPDEPFTKDDLVFELMIRQPDFVTEEYAKSVIEAVRSEKNPEFIDRVEFKTIEEGLCVQMLHLGSYDSEPATFEIMEEYARTQGLKRESKTHREIYISAPGKTPPEKLKTTLRFRAIHRSF